MKKTILSLCVMAVFAVMSTLTVSAQTKTEKKKQTVETKASAAKSADVAGLKKPTNVKGAKAPASRGDVYGPNYSDIVVKNFTSYSVDIYVDGSYRGTVAAGYQMTTWAIPGTTKLYGKATFTDGSYLSWGPMSPKTGYQYTWSLYP